jgi:UDP-3-O-[3-hydroxymyristoyl] glucosamine N-acyltransferase
MRVDQIAKLVGGDAQGDGARKITGIAGLDGAGPSDLSFAEGERALEQAAKSAAGCILVPQGSSLADKTTVAVINPKLALIKAAEAILAPVEAKQGLHSSAVINASAQLSEDVCIGAHTVVDGEVKIGRRAVLGASVVVGRGAEIGEDTVLHAGVRVYPQVQIGNRVIIHSGAVIGADGFGYVFAEGRHQKFPQLGGVIIEDDVEIGANSAIDRGSLGTTVIGRGTKIDNLVQIAHNVRIGRHCVIAAQTGISGSVEIGSYVVIGGQVGIGDKVRIEDQSVIGAQAGIPSGKIIRRGSRVWGTPARPMAEFKKIYAQLVNLPNLARRVKELSKIIASSKTDPD